MVFKSVLEIKNTCCIPPLSYIKQTILKYHAAIYTQQDNRKFNFKGIVDLSREYFKKKWKERISHVKKCSMAITNKNRTNWRNTGKKILEKIRILKNRNIYIYIHICLTSLSEC